MNLYAFSVLCFGVTSFFIGLQIFVRRKDVVGLIYFLLSFLYCAFGIGFSLCISGNLTYSDSLLAVRIANIAAAFIPVVWLHFCLFYTERIGPKPELYSILYLVPLTIVLGVFSENFVSGLRSIVGFKYCPIPGFFYHIHTSIYFVITPIGFYHLWKYIETLSGEDRRRQMSFLFVSLVGYLGGGLSFFPVYDLAVPQYGLFLLPIYPFGLAYFMSSKGLMNLQNLAEAAHKDKLAALGILTASINHEIRAPLFMMRGLAETQAKDSELGKKFLTQIDRITGIVSRLTHFAKKGVEEEAKMEAIDLKEVLADIRPLFQHQLNYQSIEYTQDIPADLPKVLADRRYLEEILFNLILNACQALIETPNPKISLSAMSSLRSRGDTHDFMTVVTIADNGPGIPQDQIENIFRPFHTTKQAGTGLGLYITRQLVEKCGGGIGVASQVQGGTRFTLRVGSAGRI